MVYIYRVFLLVVLVGYSRANAQGLFQRTIRHSTVTNISAIAPTPDGGYVAAGWIDDADFTGHNGFLIKLSASAQEEWSKAISVNGILDLTGISVDGAGNIFCSGTVSSINSDVFVGLFSPSGELLSNAVFDYGSSETIYSMAKVDGGYLLSGSVTNELGSAFGIVIKVDSVGTKQWSKKIESDEVLLFPIVMLCATERTNHSITLAGVILQQGDQPSINSLEDILTITLSPSGIPLSKQHYKDSSFNLVPFTMIVGADNSLILGGSATDVSSFVTSTLVLRIEPDLHLRWSNRISTFSTDNINGLIELNDGRILATTQTMRFGGPAASHLLELRDNGTVISLMEAKQNQSVLESITLCKKEGIGFTGIGNVYPDSVNSMLGFVTISEALKGCALNPVLGSSALIPLQEISTENINVSDIAGTKLNEPIMITAVQEGQNTLICSDPLSEVLMNKVVQPLVSLYPNPATSKQNIVAHIASIAEGAYKFRIRAMTGEVVSIVEKWVGEQIHNIEIPINALASGVYVVECIDANSLASVWHEKVIIQ